MIELCSRLPRTSGGIDHPLGNADLLGLQVADQLWEAFVKRSRSALNIPDKVPNSHRREVFAFVPSGEAFNGSSALVSPDFLADGFGINGVEKNFPTMISGRQASGRWIKGEVRGDATGYKYHGKVRQPLGKVRHPLKSVNKSKKSNHTEKLFDNYHKLNRLDSIAVVEHHGAQGI